VRRSFLARATGFARSQSHSVCLMSGLVNSADWGIGAPAAAAGAFAASWPYETPDSERAVATAPQVHLQERVAIMVIPTRGSENVRSIIESGRLRTSGPCPWLLQVAQFVDVAADWVNGVVSTQADSAGRKRTGIARSRSIGSLDVAGDAVAMLNSAHCRLMNQATWLRDGLSCGEAGGPGLN